jgi:hypothetical protein
MDKMVCIKFYQIQRLSKDDEAFSDSLNRAFSRRQGEWINLEEDVYVRLERFAIEGTYITGEFTRKQTVNLPPKVKNNGMLEPSPDPIAHRAAFQYHPVLGILAIESNRSSVTLGKINLYLQKLLGHHGFEFLPVPSKASWDRLSSCNPRSITIKLACPENMRAVEGASRTLTQNLAAMKDVFGGPVVEINVGFGRQRDGFLNKRNLINVVRGLMRQQDEVGNVEKIQIKADGEDETIDLLLEQIKEKEVLELNDKNIESHYITRKQFLERMFRTHMTAIREIYSQAA